MKRISIFAAVAISFFLACQKEAEPIVQKAATPAKRPVLEREYRPTLPVRTIHIDSFAVAVEVADEPEERGRGLMFRTYLPDSAGMLFIFDEEKPHPFWMKNTLIPLAIAFVGADSIITDIEWMKPGDLSPHAPSKPILYAIELNRGWFTARGIRPGAKVRFSKGEDIAH